MTPEEFCASDRIILNHFLAFSNGKFIATCLMLSDDVYKILSVEEIYCRITADARDWNQVEYNDLTFWWRDHNVDWFNSPNWFNNLNSGPREAVANNKYVFYTCHESVQYCKNIFPNARVLSIVPDVVYCRINYKNKNWMIEQPVFETSRVWDELQAFKSNDSDILVHQRDLFQEQTFVNLISHIANKLNITIDMDRVLEYRSLYFKNKFNQL